VQERALEPGAAALVRGPGGRFLRLPGQRLVGDPEHELLQQQLRVFREGLIRRHYTDAEVDTQVAALEQRLRDKMI